MVLNIVRLAGLEPLGVVRAVVALHGSTARQGAQAAHPVSQLLG
jgi:hypothetical protein